jgi:uncharacterized phage-like protein YoqJ
MRGNKMILGITGHRPTEIGGYNTNNPIYQKLYSLVKIKFQELNPTKIISGMALGADQLAVSVAIELGIPFIAAVPFEGQESIWPAESQRKYKELLNLAEKVVIVSPGSFSVAKMMERNQYIINNSDQLLALWNGKLTGGTASAVRMAKEKKDYIIHIISP